MSEKSLEEIFKTSLKEGENEWLDIENHEKSIQIEKSIAATIKISNKTLRPNAKSNMKSSNLLVWIGSFLMILIGVLFLFFSQRS